MVLSQTRMLVGVFVGACILLIAWTMPHAEPAASPPDCTRGADGMVVCRPPADRGDTSSPKLPPPTDNGSSTGDRAAHAQGTLDASYTISFARIPVGEITATVVFGDREYAISARARAGGVMKVLSVDGEASFNTRGAIKDGHPVPTDLTSKIVSDAETSDVTMVLDEGDVRELSATPPPSQDRVPITEANRQGIVDPLTALLFSAAAGGEACRHTLPIFDGQRRYDLKLAFKRMDKVTAEKGYAGPVVVCSVRYEPIAGHRASRFVKYLSEGREMEMALAPITGTRLLAPFRLSVPSTLANLMIEANRFETTSQPSDASSSTTAGPKAR
jgi:Protein of unknown function (DUF3108)